MNKIMRLLSFLLIFVFTMSVFTGCKQEPIYEQVFETEYETIVEPGKDLVTIQWVWGQKLLKEELVERGSKLTEWTPEIEGREFQGWYERPYIKKVDFEKLTAKKSMTIYASFKSLDDSVDIEQEMPDWYLIGAGKGDLSKSNNWNHEASAGKLGLYAGEDGIYKITLSLYAGDQFKMTSNLGWDNEKAIDKMAGFANGSVKDAAGNVVFTAGENNNFVVADGQDGKYEITYDANADVMGFTKLEALETMPDDIRLIGTFNGWNTNYSEDDYKFTSADGVNWTLTWEVTDITTFKVYNNSSGVYYPGGVDNDLHIDVPGTYTVNFNSKTRDVVVTDANGNTVDVGFSNTSGGDNGGGSATPNANPVEKVYVVLNSAWNDGSLIGAWTWPGDIWATAVATDNPNVFEIAIPAGTNMIIFVDFNSGTTDPSWDAMREQTADLAIPDKSDDKIYYHVSNGTWSNSSESTGGGSTGGGSASTDALTIYFRNDWLWTNVSCHYWGGEETAWPGAPMQLIGSSEGYEVYSITLPAGTTGFLFTGVKNDGSGDTDQSPDLSVDGLVNGQGFKMIWNGANAVEGFNYDPTACVHTYVGGVCSQCGARIAYTVAGSDTLCGTSWDTENTANDMEWDETAGVYKKVYTNLAAGSYEFKVVQDHSWGVNWGQGGHNGGNFKVDITVDGCTLTITFDGTTVSHVVTQ